jgi:hypothetical protein
LQKSEPGSARNPTSRSGLFCWFCKKPVKAPYDVIVLMNTQGVYDLRYDYACPVCYVGQVLPSHGIGASFN